MKLLEYIHGEYVHTRRVRVLRDHLAALIPPGARVLDVGAGDGLLAYLIAQKRPDLEMKGIDVLVRPRTHIPVEMFDGQMIPYADSSFDAVLLVDVLHHTNEPTALLAEAVRVACQAIVIKDHTPTGFLAQPTLRFMDRTSNARYGVLLPCNYWPREKWLHTFETLRLRVSVWNKNLQLYPRPADWVFGRSLHFVARLDCNNKKPILNDLRMPQPSRALRESPRRL